MRLLALALAAALPHGGAVVPWQSVGGVSLGMTAAQVEHVWGTHYGLCRGCAQKTWYFNYEPYHPEGAAVRFRKGRVDAVWTLWKPPDWHLGKIALGAPAESLSGRWAVLVTVPCGSYEARILTKRGVTTVIYVYADQVWAFGLSRANASPCH